MPLPEGAQSNLVAQEPAEDSRLPATAIPVAVLGPPPATETIPLIGALKNRICIADDFDDLPAEFRVT